MISRCDSAAIVPKTNELLPEPDTPVNTVSSRLPMSTLMSLRLLTRAPTTRMTSWCRLPRSRAGRPALLVVALISLRPGGQLLDADHVAGGVTDGAVAHPVRLVDRLLHHLDATGLQAVEGAVEVGGGQVQAPPYVPLAIISTIVRRSSSVMPGSTAGGCSTMAVLG